MRKEPYDVGSYVHVVNRGTRGLPLVRDEQDRRRFALMLRHFNDHYCPDNWFKDIYEMKPDYFGRPRSWPPQNKLVEIICFCLVENHFHLLLKEITDDGITKFMKRLGVGMTCHFNEKYQEKGSLFQGSYRARTVDSDDYLNTVSAYIQVKNSFEIFPRGYKSAVNNFDEAYDWAKKYFYCSLGEFVGTREERITNPELLGEIFNPDEYKEFCRDFIEGRSEIPEPIVAFE